MDLHASTAIARARPTSSAPFDAWFFTHPGELALLRRALGQWLTDCGLDPRVASEMVIAAHEATNACIGPRGGDAERDGVAVHADFDGEQVAVTLVAADHVHHPVLADARSWSTQLVLQLVDEAEVEARDGAAQVSLRRDTR